MDKTPEMCWQEFDPDGDDEEKKAACKRLHGTVSRLEQDQAGRITDMFKLMSVYQNRDMTLNSPFRSSLLRSKPVSIINVSQAIIDTLVAKHVANESKATFDVDDGDWEATMKAEELDKFCFGEVYRLKLYSLYELAFRDAAVVGDGWVKFYARDKKVFAERVFPVEMRLDPAQCVSGPPRDMYQIRYISRSQAMAYYNDFAEEICDLPTINPPYPYPGITRDIVRLVEAWHLPDSDSGEGGRYAFACNDIPLSFKEYTRGEFPFVRFSWAQDMMGGYAIGLQEQLVPLQSELDKLKKRHLQGLYIHGLPRVYQAQGSKLSPEDLTNSTIQKWVYTGSKPEVDQSQCVAPELVKEIESIIAQMWQLSGVSPLQSGSDMPSRMDSRPGLREYAALSDEKHAMPSKMWDRGILDGNRNIIAVTREIVADGGTYSTMGAAKEFVGKIEWKDCDLDDDRFRMKLQNTNLLPTTPAGKILKIQDLAQAGAFQQDPKMLWLLLSGSPDVDEVIGNETAGEKLVRKQVYMIMHKKKYFGPDKHQDVQSAMTYVNNEIQKLLMRTNGSTEKGDVATIYRLLDQYCLECKDILNQVAQAAQQQAMAAQQGAMNAGASPGAGAGGPAGPAAGGAGPAPAGPVAA